MSIRPRPARRTSREPVRKRNKSDPTALSLSYRLADKQLNSKTSHPTTAQPKRDFAMRFMVMVKAKSDRQQIAALAWVEFAMGAALWAVCRAGAPARRRWGWGRKPLWLQRLVWGGHSCPPLLNLVLVLVLIWFWSWFGFGLDLVLVLVGVLVGVLVWALVWFWFWSWS
jgi:hypothetical protein